MIRLYDGMHGEEFDSLTLVVLHRSIVGIYNYL